jgi:hypothetical protein
MYKKGPKIYIKQVECMRRIHAPTHSQAASTAAIRNVVERRCWFKCQSNERRIGAVFDAFVFEP